MHGLFIALSFVVWIGIWVLVVRNRGGLGRLGGNIAGAVVGFLVASVFLNFVLPDPPPTAKSVTSAASKPAAASDMRASVPSSAIDEITLLYLNHKVYPNDPTVCETKRIGARDMVGCRAQGWGGDSQVHIWEYSQGKFRSINGSARSLAETKFSNESVVEISPLPLPADIKVDEIVKAFSKS